jgi:SNF family Na+-dependent transporter
MPNIVGYASDTVLPSLISNVSWFAYYFHPLFVIVFVLAPLTMAISSYEKFTPILKESILIVRRELGYYLALTVWTLLLMFILLTLSNFINPSILAVSRPMTVELLIGAIYSLLFTLILLTFYITALRNILSLSKKV